MPHIPKRQSIDENRRRLIKIIGVLPLAPSATAWSAPPPANDGPDPRIATLTPRISVSTRWYRIGTTWRPVNALIASGERSVLLADPMPSEANARALIETARSAPMLLLVVADRTGAREALACARALGVPARIADSPEEIDLGDAVARTCGGSELDVRIDAARLRFGDGAVGGASGWFVPFTGQPQWLGPSARPI